MGACLRVEGRIPGRGIYPVLQGNIWDTKLSGYADLIFGDYRSRTVFYEGYPLTCVLEDDEVIEGTEALVKTLREAHKASEVMFRIVSDSQEASSVLASVEQMALSCLEDRLGIRAYWLVDPGKYVEELPAKVGSGFIVTRSMGQLAIGVVSGGRVIAAVKKVSRVYRVGSIELLKPRGRDVIDYAKARDVPKLVEYRVEGLRDYIVEQIAVSI